MEQELHKRTNARPGKTTDKEDRDRLREAVRLLDNVAMLPLGRDSVLAEKIRSIYRAAK